MPIFTFPDDAIWNDEIRAVEFTVEVGEYTGTVTIPRTVFQRFVPSPTDQTCLDAFYQYRAQFERIVELKIGARQLTDNGNVALTAKDLSLADIS